jgi:hypothetical protein
MNGMVSRVAKAIYKASNDISEYDAEVAARAAIEAMREPAAAVLEAGPPEPYMDRDVWSKMINAALEKEL